MEELLFPIAAVLAIFFFAIPVLTLISRIRLRTKRERTENWADFGSETTFAWIVAPSFLPILWLASSALHQSETGTGQDVCLIDHVQETTCDDAIFLLALLTFGILISIGFRIWREQPRFILGDQVQAGPLFARITSIVNADSNLQRLKILVVLDSIEPVFTFGLIRPIVVLNQTYAEGADDEMIRAALLHEYAHIQSFDTFRGFVARLALAVNPIGNLLRNDFQHWQAAREAQCDSIAVDKGGEPLALAESLIYALRFSKLEHSSLSISMLCGHEKNTLELRLALLLYGPKTPIRTIGHTVLLGGILIALIIPHFESTGFLEHFHYEIELFFQ